MKRLSLCLSVLLTLIFGSCSEKRHATPENGFDVDLSPKGKEIAVSDVVDVVDWIKFESDSSSYIGNARKIEYYDSDFYVWDNMSQECIVRFAHDGSFIAKIGRTGNGEGEYTHMFDFTIDKKNGKVLVLTDNSTLMVYDREGNFEKRTKLSDGYVGNIAWNNDCLIATSDYAGYDAEGNNYLIYKFGSSFHQEGEWIKYEKPLQPPYSIFINSPLTTFGDCTYYVDNLHMRIVAYDGAAETASTCFNFHVDNPMPAAMYLDPMEFMKHQLDYTWIKDVIFSKSGILIGYVGEPGYSLAILDYDGNKTADGAYPASLPENCTSDGDYVYSAISSDRYLGLWERLPEIKKPAFEVTHETNLILMKWKVKAQKTSF